VIQETVLLTGYAGFIGSQLLKDLIKEGYRVIGVDNFSDGSNKDSYKGLESYFSRLNCDIADPKLESLLKDLGLSRIDYIINCAAESHVDRSWDQINKFIDSNIKGPINLVNLVLNKFWGIKRFVQVSTDEVFADSTQPFHEGSLHTPQNAYATSKASAEMFLKNYGKAFKLPLIITNGANTYGKFQFEEKIIPLTIKRILTGQKVPLYKTPAQRMWLHVEDHSSGIIHALQFGEIGERYCLAPNVEDELYTSELVKLICSLLDVAYSNVVDLVEDRPNYDLRYLMSNAKATHTLGWLPQKHIKEELPRIVDHYKSIFWRFR